jgi:hypothetical protein
MFTLERVISSKNCSIGPKTVRNSEVFTSKGFIVYKKHKYQKNTKLEKDGFQHPLPHNKRLGVFYYGTHFSMGFN